MLSKVFRTIVVLVAVYVILGALLFLNQKNMIYYPDSQDFEACPGFSEYEKINHKETRLYFKNKSDSVLVYYHGNAGSACDRSITRSTFEQTNHSLLFVEYAGYSNDKRKPSQRLILQDVRNVHDFVGSFKDVNVYGQSIGSGAASYHASLGNVDNLILVTSFASLNEVAQSKYPIYPTSLILQEKFNNIKWLEMYTGKVVIIHGDGDVIIPHKFSQKLYNEIPAQDKEYVLIKEKGHNDIWDDDVFKQKILEFIT